MNRIKIMILVTFFLLTIVPKGFAMNPLAEIAINLKAKGYPQGLIIGDNIYLTKVDDYIRFEGKEITDEWVKVPKIENLITNLGDINYTLKHEYQGKSNGENKEMYTISDGDIVMQNENIWAAMAKFWIYKKGAK